ncbi:DUF3825 domain-containing protein [Bifidobacterium sp. ESL0745]|uniref:DUF3825 domain-containing protein n=1 Tax=Bifidobacterium sp. ESL0745 TaxID=2983226 RepID=UPI0023F7446E|nr:DUF3825 domain-containing protein [Bifidobacterium sp. ESL0745]MDF7665528.1 DUF3825 domain-containing protein [Bifidobacterium sp. ESL0745]
MNNSAKTLFIAYENTKDHNGKPQGENFQFAIDEWNEDSANAVKFRIIPSDQVLSGQATVDIAVGIFGWSTNNSERFAYSLPALLLDAAASHGSLCVPVFFTPESKSKRQQFDIKQGFTTDAQLKDLEEYRQLLEKDRGWKTWQYQGGRSLTPWIKNLSDFIDEYQIHLNQPVPDSTNTFFSSTRSTPSNPDTTQSQPSNANAKKQASKPQPAKSKTTQKHQSAPAQSVVNPQTVPTTAGAKDHQSTPDTEETKTQPRVLRSTSTAIPAFIPKNHNPSDSAQQATSSAPETKQVPLPAPRTKKTNKQQPTGKTTPLAEKPRTTATPTDMPAKQTKRAAATPPSIAPVNPTTRPTTPAKSTQSAGPVNPPMTTPAAPAKPMAKQPSKKTQPAKPSNPANQKDWLENAADQHHPNKSFHDMLRQNQESATPQPSAKKPSPQKPKNTSTPAINAVNALSPKTGNSAPKAKPEVKPEIKPSETGKTEMAAEPKQSNFKVANKPQAAASRKIPLKAYDDDYFYRKVYELCEHKDALRGKMTIDHSNPPATCKAPLPNVSSFFDEVEILTKDLDSLQHMLIEGIEADTLLGNAWKSSVKYGDLKTDRSGNQIWFPIDPIYMRDSHIRLACIHKNSRTSGKRWSLNTIPTTLNKYRNELGFFRSPANQLDNFALMQARKGDNKIIRSNKRGKAFDNVYDEQEVYAKLAEFADFDPFIEHECWDSKEEPYDILRTYLSLTLCRCRNENKLHVSLGDKSEGDYAIFNTGLLGPGNEPIYACFERCRYSDELKGNWILQDFGTKMESAINKGICFAIHEDSLPQAPSHIPEFDLEAFRKNPKIIPNIDHFVFDHPERFPRSFWRNSLQEADIEDDESKEVIEQLYSATTHANLNKADQQFVKRFSWNNENNGKTEGENKVFKDVVNRNFKKFLNPAFTANNASSIILPNYYPQDMYYDMQTDTCNSHDGSEEFFIPIKLGYANDTVRGLVVAQKPDGSIEVRSLFPLDFVYETARLFGPVKTSWLDYEKAFGTQASRAKQGSQVPQPTQIPQTKQATD